ncbi:MAG: hypothetical protein NT007_13885 [Candidatus Kapabacteria bacterium]|nr:hypothetical protein [Candidatus Kapabacteria bacterium]
MNELAEYYEKLASVIKKTMLEKTVYYIEINKLTMEVKIAVLVMILFPYFIFAQITVSSSTALVGDEIVINMNIKLPVSGTLTIDGQLKLSNPTVIYPDSFNINKNYKLINSLKRLNDSVYSFSILISGYPATEKEVDIKLNVEALAGSDTFCMIKFSKLSYNTITLSDIDVDIIINSFGSPVPYIRNIKLEQNYPNPILLDNVTTWNYYLDVETNVEFIYYNFNADQIHSINLGKQKKGAHSYIWKPDNALASGAYKMKIKTEYSVDSKNFIYIK